MISEIEIQNLIQSNYILQKELESNMEGKREQELELPSYELSENEKIIVSALKDDLPQLSPFVIFTLSNLLGGNQTLLIGCMSSGKSKCMKCIMNSKVNYSSIPNTINNINKEDKDISSNNLSSNLLKIEKKANATNIVCLDSIDESAKLNELSNRSSWVFIDDFTKLIFSSKIPPSETIPMLSAIAQTHTYVSTNVNIQNADVRIVSGVTELAYSKLIQEPVWLSQGKDRFMRLYIMYYNRPNPKRFLRDDEWKSFEINVSRATFNDGLDISKLRDILSCQISYDRTDQWIIRTLEGHASLCNRREVTQDDISWFLLYEPVLTLDKLSDIKLLRVLYYRFKNKNYTKKQLANYCGISEDELEKALSELNEYIKLDGKSEWEIKLEHLHKTYGGLDEGTGTA
jgi:hypothetical protein